MQHIIYSDNHVLLLYKKGGILTQTNDSNELSLEVEAKKWIKETFHKSGAVFLQAVHRLDRVTSGLILFARTSKALSRLMEQMREKKMEKIYLAVVEGELKTSEGTLEHLLVHSNKKARIALQPEEDSKHSRLHYKVLQIKEGFSLIEVYLDTGRYHQIRAQFSHMGHPIVGDDKYGSRYTIPQDKIALEHSFFVFYHPITQQKLEFKTSFADFWPFSLFAV